MKNGIRKVVLTGGPGAGKTTAVDLLRREIGESIVVVPEAATMIFSSGFPRYNEPLARKATQSTIYHLQKNLEFVQSQAFPQRTLLCDRGTLDSAAYWPNGMDDFYAFMETTEQAELDRYDAVIFFQTSAVANKSVIEMGNPTRNESIEQAQQLDQKLYGLWSKHPHFYHIQHRSSFMEKLNLAIHCVRGVIGH